MMIEECFDCDVNTIDTQEYYIVHDELWRAETTPDDEDAMLCILCFEDRLGRKLTRDDFALCPANLTETVSERFRNRRGDFAEVYAERIMQEQREMGGPVIQSRLVEPPPGTTTGNPS